MHTCIEETFLRNKLALPMSRVRNKHEPCLYMLAAQDPSKKRLLSPARLDSALSRMPTARFESRT